jgi:hypothetical protein
MGWLILHVREAASNSRAGDAHVVNARHSMRGNRTSRTAPSAKTSGIRRRHRFVNTV